MANYLFGLFEKTTKPFPPAHLWPNGVAPDIEILREVIWTYPAPPPGVPGARGNPNASWLELPSDAYMEGAAICNGMLFTKSQTTAWVEQQLNSLPSNMEHVAVVQVVGQDNFNVKKFLVDTNKTRVAGLKSTASSSGKIGPCICATYWTPDSIMNIAKSRDHSIRFDAANRCNSALSGGVPIGQNPPVSMGGQVLYDNMWLNEMYGRVVIYKTVFPRNDTGLDIDWADIGFDLFFGVLEDFFDTLFDALTGRHSTDINILNYQKDSQDQ
ncbi:hypothetical protein KHP07_11940 [Pseudomonas sp. VS40]|uniref:hypothetical protein n=1 Tax=unclassified Pseudomonas TaxID=196821 RepID=UPI001BDF1ABB|nr:MULTISPECIES: hypothetical protein [unclassified Pseudomonas]MBT1261072.1 hypothetical protein [Pseudomonas sp. VS40]MBT1272987.1 hypothetical protein [Pseudomonas sp. VS59]